MFDRVSRLARLVKPDAEDAPLPPEVPADFTEPDIDNTLPRTSLEDMILEHPTSSLTGVWLPENNLVVIATRRLRHHPGMFEILDEQGLMDGDFYPFIVASNQRLEGRRPELDFPRSAGGAFQWASKNNANDRYVRSPERVSPRDVYGAIWGCRRAGVPPGAIASIGYLPSDAPDADPRTLREFHVVQADFRMIDLYRELAFANVEPEPVVERVWMEDGGIQLVAGD